jgi:hypothetical protein
MRAYEASKKFCPWKVWLGGGELVKGKQGFQCLDFEQKISFAKKLTNLSRKKLGSCSVL